MKKQEETLVKKEKESFEVSGKSQFLGRKKEIYRD